MESRVNKIIYLLIWSFVFQACDKFELRGFILSYESPDRRFEQSMKWNSENPYKEINVTSDDYTICVMADSHTGTTKNLDLFMEQAIQMNALAAVMAGDITNGHREDYVTFKGHLPDQNDLLTFQIAGNHDLYFDGWKQFYSLFGSSTYIFKVKTPVASDLFICTDTGSGTLGSDQLDWLKDVLENMRQNYRYCIIFTHNNLFRIRHTVSTNPFVEELRVLLELFLEHQVDMVIAGHDHEKNVVLFGNTTHITLDALKDDYKNAGYLNVFIKQGKIDYEFINF